MYIETDKNGVVGCIKNGPQVIKEWKPPINSYKQSLLNQCSVGLIAACLMSDL